MQCDECDIWYHTSCMGVTSLNYEVLANSNISWTCCNCGIPNFSTSLFSQWTIEFTNSFSTLSNLSKCDDLPTSPPVATSSPKSSQHKNKNADAHHQTKNTRKPQRSLKVLVVNFQSIKNKVPELTACLENHSPDVVIGTETWLYPSVLNSELFPEDYTVIRKDRNDKHGGVLLALKNDVVCAHLTDLDANCEMVWAQVQLVGSKALYIGAFYRPQTQKDLKYMNELRQSLTIIKNSHKGNIWLGGDFNLGGINWQNQSINQGTCISPKNLSEQLIDIALTYLGVDIQHDLKWNTHVNRITTSASKTLGFVRRNLSSCNKEIKAAAYIALVRPTGEYCSAVWDPHTKELIQKVEKIQRRAARMVYNNYDWKTSVSELIQELQWDSLSDRRKNNRLAILHKAIGGHLAIPVQNYLHPAQRRTRRSSKHNYIEYQSRKDSHKYSFIPRTIKDWNDLPESVASIPDPTAFKTALSNQVQEKQVD